MIDKVTCDIQTVNVSSYAGYQIESRPILPE